MQKEGRTRKIGVLTGGGDSSGINAVFHGICLEARNKGIEVIGFLDGWHGVIEGKFMPLSSEKTVTVVNQSGTILGTSRTNPYKIEKIAEIKKQMKGLNLDGLIAIGGNDTLTVASRLADDLQLNIIGIPQTIDNDVPGTDYCVGFDTAVKNAVEAIHNVRATCNSHKEDIVVEVMGRDSGWIAAVAGLTAGAEFIFVPELSFDADLLVEKLKLRHEQGFLSNVIVIAEGVREFDHTKIDSGVDAFGNAMLGGIGFSLRDYIQTKLNKKSRAIVLSYIQRGGMPSSYEVFMDLKFGQTAVKLLAQGKSNLMVAYSSGIFQPVKLSLACGKQPVKAEILQMVKELTL